MFKSSHDRNVIVGGLILLSFAFSYFSGFLSHDFLGERSHVHGFLYTHEMIDMHNGVDEAHPHHGENGYEAGMPDVGRVAAIALLVLALVFLSVLITPVRLLLDQHLEAHLTLWKSRREDDHVPLLTLLFSNGILNPKLY